LPRDHESSAAIGKSPSTLNVADGCSLSMGKHEGKGVHTSSRVGLHPHTNREDVTVVAEHAYLGTVRTAVDAGNPVELLADDPSRHRSTRPDGGTHARRSRTHRDDGDGGRQ